MSTKKEVFFFLAGIIVGAGLLFGFGNMRTMTYAWTTTDGKYVDIQETAFFEYMAHSGYRRTTRRVSDWKEVSIAEIYGSTWTIGSTKGGFLYTPKQVDWVQVYPKEKP